MQNIKSRAQLSRVEGQAELEEDQESSDGGEEEVESAGGESAEDESAGCIGFTRNCVSLFYVPSLISLAPYYLTLVVELGKGTFLVGGSSVVGWLLAIVSNPGFKSWIVIPLCSLLASVQCVYMIVHVHEPHTCMFKTVFPLLTTCISGTQPLHGMYMYVKESCFQPHIHSGYRKGLCCPCSLDMLYVLPLLQNSVERRLRRMRVSLGESCPPQRTVRVKKTERSRKNLQSRKHYKMVCDISSLYIGHVHVVLHYVFCVLCVTRVLLMV